MRSARWLLLCALAFMCAAGCVETPPDGDAGDPNAPINTEDPNPPGDPNEPSDPGDPNEPAGPTDPNDPTGPPAGEPEAQKVIDAQFPVAIDFAPDGRIFYTEKATGRVRIIKNGTLLPDPFVTVSVVNNSERGLLGIALHPNFTSNGHVYVFYTRAGNVAAGAEANRVARFTASGDVAAPGETIIIDLPVSAAGNHNGGNIRFGPDGKLYITIGELADPDTAQDVGELQGKILRLNDDGSVPADNPMAGSEVYAYGLRNSFDFAFDPVSGEIFATENGPNANDELNRILAGGNYGWPEVHGFADNAAENSFAATTPNYHDPLFAMTPTTSPTGIDFAPDNLIGAANLMYYGEYNTGRVWRVVLNDARDAITSRTQLPIGPYGAVIDVAFAPDGRMYVLTTTEIWRIVPEAAP